MHEDVRPTGHATDLAEGRGSGSHAFELPAPVHCVVEQLATASAFHEVDTLAQGRDGIGEAVVGSGSIGGAGGVGSPGAGHAPLHGNKLRHVLAGEDPLLDALRPHELLQNIHGQVSVHCQLFMLAQT